MPSSLSDLQHDHLYTGYIVTVTPNTASIRFLGRDRLVVLRKELSSKHIKKASEVVAVGQSVVVKAIIGETVNGSLKCSPSEEEEALLVASFQEERLRLLDSGNYEVEEEVASEEEEEEGMEEEEKEEEEDNDGKMEEEEKEEE